MHQRLGVFARRLWSYRNLCLMSRQRGCARPAFAGNGCCGWRAHGCGNCRKNKLCNRPRMRGQARYSLRPWELGLGRACSRICAQLGKQSESGRGPQQGRWRAALQAAWPQQKRRALAWARRDPFLTRCLPARAKLASRHPRATALRKPTHHPFCEFKMMMGRFRRFWQVCYCALLQSRRVTFFSLA